LVKIDKDNWRSRISWLGQQPYLFRGSIRENICLGSPHATKSAVRKAAADAHVLAFTEQLPSGLDTVVGEQAFGLSRGQAQRVALARTILKNSSLLLLDEPTSGLDVHSERLVLETLEHLGRNRTVIMVTHRLTNIENADRIYVMDKGVISEQGRYQDLISADGLFRQMTLKNIL
jgi:ATP-binding cassette subfamily C protein CydD